MRCHQERSHRHPRLGVQNGQLGALCGDTAVSLRQPAASTSTTHCPLGPNAGPGISRLGLGSVYPHFTDGETEIARYVTTSSQGPTWDLSPEAGQPSGWGKENSCPRDSLALPVRGPQAVRGSPQVGRSPPLPRGAGWKSVGWSLPAKFLEKASLSPSPLACALSAPPINPTGSAAPGPSSGGWEGPGGAQVQSPLLTRRKAQPPVTGSTCTRRPLPTAHRSPGSWCLQGGEGRGCQRNSRCLCGLLPGSSRALLQPQHSPGASPGCYPTPRPAAPATQPQPHPPATQLQPHPPGPQPCCGQDGVGQHLGRSTLLGPEGLWGAEQGKGLQAPPRTPP